jgi:hypothetical protein
METNPVPYEEIEIQVNSRDSDPETEEETDMWLAFDLLSKVNDADYTPYTNDEMCPTS